MPLLDEIIHTFLQASPYILLGLFFSAIIQSLIPKEKIAFWIGQKNLRSVLIAAVAGIPLPLCSCGVIPMAMSLRQNGASRGATTSFLIATPETGIDSIMLSFALLDPIMAIFRPLAALVTAIIAGIIENIFDRSKEQSKIEPIKDCCAKEKPQVSAPSSWSSRLVYGFKHSFVTLLGDIMGWLTLGLVLSGVISYLVPSSMIERFLGTGMSSMFLMLVVGIPLYICASASTPIAASLLLKGASPGAAFVFLLAGPATNVTTMVMVYRFLGSRALVIYIASIAGCAITFGMLLNHLYAMWNIDVRAIVGQAGHCVDITWQVISAGILLLFMAHACIKKYF
jgi:uncharacterized membrane protein YraQ (UPF0718 family)